MFLFYIQVDLPPSSRVQRSMSFSTRRPRDRVRKDEVSDGGSLKRSSSVKGRNDKSKTKDEKSEAKTEKSKGTVLT